MMKKLYYKHIRIPEWMQTHPKHHFDMTLAASVENDKVKIGIAVCSVKDQFSKKNGRDYAIERVMYCPTFEFPVMHKSVYQAAHYWFDVLYASIMYDGKPIKDRVSKLQRAFNKTETGIRLKINRDNKAKEQKQKEIYKAKS